jgi:hypothetical protein
MFRRSRRSSESATRFSSVRRYSLVVLLAVLAPAGSPADAAAPERGLPATRAEVQIELCTPFAEIERSLKLRAHGDPIDVWLFDDSAMTLFDRGLRLRLRVSGKRAEFTVKIANQDCARIDAKMVPPKLGKCEYDVHGARMAGAVSLSRNLADREWRDLVAGRVAPAELLSAVQLTYLRDVARIWPLPPQLRPLGPKKSRAYVPQNEPYEVDVSQLPSGEVYVEMSRKVPAADAQHAKDALDATLARTGVTACADQGGQAVNKLKLMLR